MTFKRVLAAAVMAAFSALSVPAQAQAAESPKKASAAKATKKKTSKPAAKNASASASVQKSSAKKSSAKKSSAKKSSVKKSSSKKSSVKSFSVKKSSVKKSSRGKSVKKSSARKKKATRVIRQNPSGQVVVERIQRATLQAYGPWLPREAFDYPRPPCPAVDPVVIEARVHEVDEDSPEAAETILAIQAATPATGRDLNELAKTVGAAIGSLLRPKSSTVKVKPEEVDLSDLVSAGLQVPVEGVDLARLRDSFLDRRGRYRKHLAIDIGAPRGTPILATTDGEIVRLSRERRGGIAVYQKDPTGQYLFFYGHLQKYASGLEVGQQVRRGDVIGYVGRTGRVVGGPHLHFSVTRLPEDGTHREGLAVNPYLLFLMGAN